VSDGTSGRLHLAELLQPLLTTILSYLLQPGTVPAQRRSFGWSLPDRVIATASLQVLLAAMNLKVRLIRGPFTTVLFGNACR